jgi:Ca2+/Na+ antiporter
VKLPDKRKLLWLFILILIILYFLITRRHSSFLKEIGSFLDILLILGFVFACLKLFLPSDKKLSSAEQLTILIALGALLYAHLAYKTGKSALEFQKEELKKQQETKINVDANWDFKRIYFSGFKEELFLVDRDNWKLEKRFSGFHFFAVVRLYNASEHAVSVSEVFGRIRYGGPSGLQQFQQGTCFESDFKRRVAFPLFLQPHESRHLLIRIPVIVDEKVKQIFSHLSPDSLYRAKEIIRTNNQRNRMKYGNEDTLGVLRLFADRFVPADSLGTRDQYRFIVLTYLSSGEEITKLYDILMNPVSWITCPPSSPKPQ